MAKKVVLAGACRTAIGTMGGTLSTTPAPELGAIVIKEALKRAGVAPEAVDQVYMGCVIQAGQGQNVARQAAIKAGLPIEVPAVTMNVVCGSGLNCVNQAAQMIMAGDADIVVAGGMENMSMAPYAIPQGRYGYRMGNIIIDPGDHFQIRGSTLGKFLSLGYHFAVRSKIHVLVGVEKRAECIRNLYIEVCIQAGGIIGTGDIFIDRHVIISVSGRQGESLIAATVQIVSIDNGIRPGNAQFDLGTGAGVIGTDIAVRHMRIVNDSHIIGSCCCSVGPGHKTDRRGIPERLCVSYGFRFRRRGIRRADIRIRRRRNCGGL